jgi:hypothetical protein
VPHVGPHRQIRLDRVDDVVEALVAFVVGVIDAARVFTSGQPRVEIARSRS